VRAGSAPTARETAPIPDKLDEDGVRRKTGTIVDELANNEDLEVNLFSMYPPLTTPTGSCDLCD